MRKQIAAANWKMNLTASQAQELAAALATGVTQVQPGQQVILGVPFPYLVLVQNKVAGNKIYFYLLKTVPIKRMALIPVKPVQKCCTVFLFPM